MSINNELEKLRNDGYCLWVGAGVTKQLAGAGVPDWRELVEQIETRAGITKDPAASFPDRLDVCLEKIGREKFQSEIRDLIYEPTKKAIRELPKKSTDPTNVVPAQVRQLAHLGSLANPIVNFNVESLTPMPWLGQEGHLRLKHMCRRLYAKRDCRLSHFGS